MAHNENNTQNTKPEWLQSLEAQSWQAELIISGILIASLTNLPDLMLHGIEHYIVQSSASSYLFVSMAVQFALIGIYAIIVIFLLHFAIRALWIALLGLNSVYPKGIQERDFMGYPASLARLAKQEFPNLTKYNETLDKFGSVLFSIAAMTLMIYAAMSLSVLVFWGLTKLITSINPDLTEPFFKSIAILVIFSFIPLFLPTLIKKFDFYKKIEPPIYKYSSIANRILYNIFYVPNSYIIYILGTNGKNTNTNNILIAVLMLVFSTMGTIKVQSSIVLDRFSKNGYARFNNYQHKIEPCNYENLLMDNTIVYCPIIPNRIIKGKSLPLFIPYIYRELEQMPERTKSKSKHSQYQRDSIRQANLKIYSDFNQIYINEVLYDSLQFYFFQHPNHGERGISTIIPTSNFNIGENILEIRKEYYSEKGVQKIIRIPFYFEGE